MMINLIDGFNDMGYDLMKLFHKSRLKSFDSRIDSLAMQQANYAPLYDSGEGDILFNDEFNRLGKKLSKISEAKISLLSKLGDLKK